MFSMKRISILLFVGIVIFLVFIGTNKQCRGINCVQFTNSEHLKEQEVYENTDKSYRALLSDGDKQARVEVYSQVTAEEAENFTQIKKMKMMGLFENARSPYPGMLSNETECDKKYIPTFSEIAVNGLLIQYIRGYLNERLQYGSCLESEIRHIGHLALFYCPNEKKWYQIEVIAKPNEQANGPYINIFKSIRCHR